MVDDDPLVRKSVEKVLTHEGYASDFAKNAYEALIKVGEQEFDLIISDIRMPGKNGVEAVREIRRRFKEKLARDIPIIFITGYAELIDELSAEVHGEVILKPFDLDHLLITIREYL